ncbi:hypothetical protein CRE_28003 [Caenorhabditis remanei]|uniref:Transposase Tc1-like domain-containing protein n=1 Tax=Caenorhabditis remanei TaxID=31234 RepID=E3NVF1_CAERE|nr:hypothetical protein CRE_28003 [Caenorhabditis remanei]
MGRPHNNKNVTLAVQEAVIQGIQMRLKRKDLALQFNLAKSSITGIFQRYELRQGVVIRKSPGRPRKTNHLTDRNIVRTSRMNPRLSAGEVAALVDGPMTPVPHVRIVRRRLAESGLSGRRPAKKPFINAKN